MKNGFWQMVRGLCIICVILIHCLFFTENLFIDYSNIVIRKIINFVVATFIFMAGYFTNIKSEKTFFRKKLFRLLPSLLIWNMIYTFIWCIGNNYNFITLLKKVILSNSAGHLYYIYVLIQLFILAPFLVKFINKNESKKIVYLPFIITPLYNLLLLILNVKFNIMLPLYQYYFLGWFSYFYLGLVIKNGSIIKFEKLKVLFVSLIIFLLLSITEGIFIYKYVGSYELAISQLGFFNIFYSITICLILYLISNSKVKVSKILIQLGDYSFGIYLSHILVLMIISKVCNLFSLNYYLIIFIKFLFTIFICYFINKIYYDYFKVKMYDRINSKK